MDNTVRLDRTQPSGSAGINVAFDTDQTAAEGEIAVTGNTLRFDSATYLTGINVNVKGPWPSYLVSKATVTGNMIASQGFRVSEGDGRPDKAIVYAPATFSGSNRQQVLDNYYNGKLIGNDIVFDDSAGPELKTYGRAIVVLKPGTPRVIELVDGYVGQTVLLRAENANVTVKNNNPFLVTHSGGDVTLVAGQCYRMIVYKYAAADPRGRWLARAEGAPF